MPVEGTFHVSDNMQQVLAVIRKADGVPRHVVCNADAPRGVCALHEPVRERTTFYIKPVPVNRWTYVNSSVVTDHNIDRCTSFSARKLRSSNYVRELITDTSVSTSFKPLGGGEEGNKRTSVDLSSYWLR